MRLATRVTRAPIVLFALVLIGVTFSTPASSDPKQRFENFLVIGITADYETRAQFERALVSQLRKEGASAATYHSVNRGNKPIIKEDVIAAIQEYGFDAVLAVRRLDGDIELQVTSSRTETDKTPIGGRIVNLFRSDYTDYTTPESVDLATSATLAIELYSAKTEEIVFAFDHETKSETNLGLLIDQTAEAIVKRINREKLIAD